MAEERQIVAQDVDRNGRHHKKQADPYFPITMRPSPIRVRVMVSTLASRRSVLVGTVLEFVHRCFLDSIVRGVLGRRWYMVRMFRLIFLRLVLRLEPVLIRLAIVAAS